MWKMLIFFAHFNVCMNVLMTTFELRQVLIISSHFIRLHCGEQLCSLYDWRNVLGLCSTIILIYFVRKYRDLQWTVPMRNIINPLFSVHRRSVLNRVSLISVSWCRTWYFPERLMWLLIGLMIIIGLHNVERYFVDWQWNCLSSIFAES